MYLEMQKIYEDVTLGFYVHEDMREIKYIQDWMSAMIRPQDNHVGFYDDYVGTIKIKRLGNASTDITSSQAYHVELVEAYPSLVGEILLGHAQGNEILRLSVTFKYRRWNSLD